MKTELTVYTSRDKRRIYYRLNQDGAMLASATRQIDGGDWFVFRTTSHAERSQIGRFLKVCDITGEAACQAAAHAIALDIVGDERGQSADVVIKHRATLEVIA